MPLVRPRLASSVHFPRLLVTVAASLLVACLLGASPAIATSPIDALWTRVSVPGSLPTAALTLDPHDHETVWAAGPRGIFRSDDLGATWAARSANLLDFSYDVLAVAPHDRDQLWTLADVERTLYRSIDGGATWRPVPEIDDARALTFGSDGTLYVVDEGSIWVSDDDGRTWDVRPAVGLGFQIAAASGVPDLLLYGSGAELFRSTDGGRSFTPVLPGGDRLLVADPHDADGFYVGGHPMHVTRDGGLTFRALDPPFLPRAMAVDPEVPGRVVIGGGDGSAAESLDGGETWTLRAPPPSPLDGARNVAVLAIPGDDQILVGGQDLGEGFLDRIDGVGDAETRTEIRTGAFGSLSYVSSTGASVYAVSAESLPLRSSDVGETWEVLPSEGYLFRRIEPGALGTIWAIARTVDGPRDRVLVCDGACSSWVDRGPIADGDTLLQLVPGTTPERARVVGREGNLQPTLRIWLTEDGGLTWRKERGDFVSSDELIFDLAVDPVISERLWLTTAEGVDFKPSIDEPWRRLPDAPTLFEITAGIGDLVYGIGAASSADGGRLWASDDAGASWRDVAPVQSYRIVAAKVRPGLLAGQSIVDGSVVVSFDSGETWNRPPTPLTRSALVRAWGPGTRLWIDTMTEGGEERGTYVGRVALDDPLALQRGRFIVEASWRDFRNRTGTAKAALRTDDTGTFWFFDDDNLELMVKVLDGRAVNGHWWVFYGASTNVQFTMTVTDRVTGEQSVYSNPLGTFASFGDITAFRAVDPSGGLDGDGGGDGGILPIAPGEPTPVLLLGDRFRARVTWRDFEGEVGGGLAVPLADDTGAFWFFDDQNLELMVKVLDGRAVNGRFWVFFGSLTNVAFTLEIEDLETGAIARYDNPIGTFASRGDVEAF